MLSKLVQALPSSPIIEVFNKAYTLRQSGVDLIDFSVGEPDFDTPDHICEAGIAAIRDGDTRYTPVDGNMTLKAAIAQKFQRDNGLPYSPDQIIACSGAKPLLAAAIQSVLNPGDEMILPTPLWASHLGMVQAVGGHPILIDTADHAFKLTPKALEAAITPNTQLLMICSPSNPTGAVYSAPELEALAEVLRAYPQVNVISDDLYEHIVFDGVQFATLAAVAPDLQDRVLTINGVSKAFAMTGWRIGFSGGPVWWADGIRSLFSQTNGGPCSISQAAAAAALTGPQAFLKDWSKIYQARRDIALSGLAEIDGLKTQTPQGAFYLMPDCGEFLGRVKSDGQIIETSINLASYLLENGVVVVPGPGFSCDPFFRMSIATSESNIREGVRRMKTALDLLT
ncbi:pyridoxal phosphate-dependent aminotransferase [Ruegeria sp.]|uniref:pyridoxal phosphate-dependent aminotransferase n=1 Tax=Ruegeria sp. TaxID=1879320 RepID=UPI003B5CA5A9